MLASCRQVLEVCFLFRTYTCFRTCNTHIWLQTYELGVLAQVELYKVLLTFKCIVYLCNTVSLHFVKCKQCVSSFWCSFSTANSRLYLFCWTYWLHFLLCVYLFILYISTLLTIAMWYYCAFLFACGMENWSMRLQIELL